MESDFKNTTVFTLNDSEMMGENYSSPSIFMIEKQFLLSSSANFKEIGKISDPNSGKNIFNKENFEKSPKFLSSYEKSSVFNRNLEKNENSLKNSEEKPIIPTQEKNFILDKLNELITPNQPLSDTISQLSILSFFDLDSDNESDTSYSRPDTIESSFFDQESKFSIKSQENPDRPKRTRIKPLAY